MADQIATGEATADDDALLGYRITGYVPHAAHRGIDPHLDVPIISEVCHNFWQGGCIDGVRLPDDFDFVLSLYPWGKYVLGPNTQRMEVKMYDSLDESCEQVDALALMLNERLDAGEKVLVHCQAGLNRSGLVAGRALIYQGCTPAEAISLLREARSPLVLCNERFENYLAGCL